MTIPMSMSNRRLDRISVQIGYNFLQDLKANTKKGRNEND